MELIEMHNAFRPGMQGVNRGRRMDGEVVIELDDGREVRFPLTKLVRIDKREITADDLSSWYPYNPESDKGRRVRRVLRDRAKGYLYEVRGSTGRWFVLRAYEDGTALESQIFRTRFFPSQADAETVFNHFVYGH
ncbi:hypothetical protein [Spirillospora sp. NPDC047279]|uniref:hypothetical protein n=1 Tax=Spirillospora sp. NPDC047279 TaxID=3155478 RepID=UPI00340A43A1